MDTKDLIKQALCCIIEAAEGNEKIKDKQGIIESLKNIRFLANKIRTNPSQLTKVGVFGTQKRGKSTLINQLLGCDLMPVAAPPMSSVIIEVEHNEFCVSNKFKLSIFRNNGFSERHEINSLENARKMLKEFGSRKGNLSSEIETIKVESNFSNSTFFKNVSSGVILVDTPGAENAFDESNNSSNSEEAKLAIKALQSMHIVIFVERADYSEGKNSYELFSREIKPMRPLTVLNFKDKFEASCVDDKLPDELLEVRRQSEMKQIMLQNYGINLDRIVCISCKEAAKAKENKDDELLKSSNLPELEERLCKDLENLDEVSGASTCLDELKGVLQQIEKLFEDPRKNSTKAIF